MNSQMVRIRAVLMRGGTSKGVILREIDLPNNKKERDKMILKIFGSPDKRQTDGLGGATPLTSKLAIIGPPTTEGAHINYTFGQVSIEKSEIDYKPTCGNLSSAVGLFAAEEGYVPLQEPITYVKMFNTNTQKIIEAEIPVKNGEIQYKGDFKIDGVPGNASRIMLNFIDSGGGLTGALLPTGNPKDTIKIDTEEEFEISVVDSANILVFVRASQLNIEGNEIDFNLNVLDKIEKIRVAAGKKIGLMKESEEINSSSHALPKIAVVESPKSYKTIDGRDIKINEINLLGRYISMGTLHQAFAVSGGIAIGTAANIPGTIINEILGNNIPNLINIGHPSGIISVNAEVAEKDGTFVVNKAAIGRTARRLMDGYAYIVKD